jgi:hypothetical protein
MFRVSESKVMRKMFGSRPDGLTQRAGNIIYGIVIYTNVTIKKMR